MAHKMIRSGCGFCDGTLPTIRLRTTQLGTKDVYVRMCRDCILVALKGIEEPEDYPCAVEDRDSDLETLRNAANA